MTFTVRDLSPRIGSEIETSRNELLAGTHADRIRTLLEQRGVLVFPGIGFSDEEMKAFATTLGKIEDGSTYEDKIFKVTFDPEHNPMGLTYLRGTFEWHVDRTDLDVPPLGSMLTPRVIAREGGQTEFANTYAAYDDLPEDEKRWLDGLRVEHRAEAAISKQVENPTPEQIAAWRQNPPKVHPLVWHHRSGRKSLLLGSTACRVVGMDEAESNALLERLTSWATQPQFVYRHHWREGDLVIWDNTGTMHRAVPFDVDCGRRLHRVTLEGVESIRAVAA
ncbi:MAG: TauD/TfdA family dioxygenase [Novosphingobium sp.]|nr:TauD/TfdA family dioxygenase [Novosphingobium sp.]